MSTFREKGRCLRSLRKDHLLATSPSIPKFKQKLLFYGSLWKIVFFLSICPKISTFRKKLRYFEIRRRFLPIYPKISTFREKGDHFQKSFFVHISKSKHLEEKEVDFSDIFEKIVFCPYLQNYQNSRKRNFSLYSFEKKVFYVNISKNINISRKITLFSQNYGFYPHIREYLHFE